MIAVHIEQAGYTTNNTVIRDIQFSLIPGQIIGLIGGNGAGKSTTIQAMLGTIAFNNSNIELPMRFGYVPERPILYEYYTLREHIHLLIQTLEDSKASLWARSEELCSLFKMSDKLDDYPTSFSKGMQQKVMLILAFTPLYTVYIIDEPFMGLDPQAIRQLLLLLQQRREDGAAILMSTHALDTAEKLCDAFICLHSGQLLAQGTLKELQSVPDEPLLDIFDRVIEEAEHAPLR